MLYQKKGDAVLAGGKMFTVGGEVFANHTCDYGGLFGTVTEIRTGPDQCTERDEPDIYCDLQPPESETMVMEIKDRFSALFGYPKQLEDLGLDCVILAPSMLEPMPEDLPAEDGRLLSLTCFYDSDSGCAAQTLALSSDMGLLLRKMREDLDTYEIPVILSHVERWIDGYQFSYEAKDAEVEGLYLSYTISDVPVFLSQPAGHNCAAQE